MRAPNKSILIVEDQPYQAEVLRDIIQKIRPNYLIEKCLVDTVSTIEYLKESEPDLIFMDIELGDQLCFEIFDHIELTTPVIYCTSHHEFALEAFYKNGIHFLTKPTTEARVLDGLRKYELLESRLGQLQEANETVSIPHNKYMLSVGKFTIPLDVDSIKYAYLKEKVVFIVMVDDKVYTTDITLDELGKQLNSNAFFRINRQLILHIDLIDKFCSLDGGRIEVHVKGEPKNRPVVSFKKRKRFLNWINGLTS